MENAVVIKEDIVHAADGHGNGNAKMAQERREEGRESGPANAKLRTK